MWRCNPIKKRFSSGDRFRGVRVLCSSIGKRAMRLKEDDVFEKRACYRRTEYVLSSDISYVEKIPQGRTASRDFHCAEGEGFALRAGEFPLRGKFPSHPHRSKALCFFPSLIRFALLRKGRDSNPRYRCRYNSFRDCPIRPL